MKSLCVFNNKGGVGKTTLLCNLAAYLAIVERQKILVVDADPQCNATSYMLKESILDKLYLPSSDTKTINQLVSSLKRGKGYSDVPIVHSDSFGLDMVPGDPKFSLAEDFLAKDWFDATNGQERGLKTTFLFKALLEWANQQCYDYVFFDIGPSLGAINRTVLLSCDYFVMPMSSDIFSLRGLQNIEVAMNTWKRSLKRGLEAYKEENISPFYVNDEIQVSEVPIRFLGYITQQYIAKTVNGKKQPVKAYEQIIKKIGPAISKHLVDSLNEGIQADYKLGDIPYFQSLVPLSQTSTKPIFSLKSSDGIVGAHFDKVLQFKDVVSSIATRFKSNIEVLDHVA